LGRHGVAEGIEVNSPSKIIDFNDIDIGGLGYMQKRGAEGKKGIGSKGREEKVTEKSGAGK
jgi:hypothetical protein